MRKWIGIGLLSLPLVVNSLAYPAFAGDFYHDQAFEIEAQAPVSPQSLKAGRSANWWRGFMPAWPDNWLNNWSNNNWPSKWPSKWQDKPTAKFRVLFDNTGAGVDIVYFTADGGDSWAEVFRGGVSNLFLPKNYDLENYQGQVPARVRLTQDADYFSRQATNGSPNDAPQLWLMSESHVVILREEQIDQAEWDRMERWQRRQWIAGLPRAERQDAKRAIQRNGYPFGRAPRRIFTRSFPAPYESLATGFGVAFFREPVRKGPGAPELLGITYWTRGGSRSPDPSSDPLDPSPGMTLFRFGQWTFYLAEAYLPRLGAEVYGGKVYLKSLGLEIDLSEAYAESQRRPATLFETRRALRDISTSDSFSSWRRDPPDYLDRVPRALPSGAPTDPPADPWPSARASSRADPQPSARTTAQEHPPAWPEPVSIVESPFGLVATYPTGVVALVRESPHGYALGEIIYAPEPTLLPVFEPEVNRRALPAALRVNFPVVYDAPGTGPRVVVRGETIEILHGQKTRIYPARCNGFFALINTGP